MAGQQDPKGTGVAISGGGHRASLFGLGAVLAMADAGVDITSVSSVSGGSLTNGWLAMHGTLAKPTPQARVDDVAPFVRQLANVGTFQSAVPISLGKIGVGIGAAFAMFFVPVDRWTRFGLFVAGAVSVSASTLGRAFVTNRGRLYGTALLPCLLAPAALPFVVFEPTTSRARQLGPILLAAAAIYLWLWALFSRRGALARHTFTRTLFPSDPKLSDIPSPIDHVFCTTEYQTRQAFYLSRNFVYGYQFGGSKPGDTTLVTAVAASAGFPIGFPPRRIPLDGFTFSKTAPTGATQLVLADGGVYDNMGDEWAAGFDARMREWDDFDATKPATLVVVNGSTDVPFTAWTAGTVMSEISAIAGLEAVQYDQTTASRRRALIAGFDASALSGAGLTGTLVQINQTPFDVADKWSETSAAFPERAARAKDVRTWLATGPKPDEWTTIAGANRAVATTLGALGPDVAGRLLFHAYVLTAANMHVILGTPLPAETVPSEQVFVDLAKQDQ